MSQRDKDRAFFVVWLLNKVAEAWHTSTAEVYRTLQGGNIVTDYILRFYDQLHTMGSEALVEDVTLLARKRKLIA